MSLKLNVICNLNLKYPEFVEVFCKAAQKEWRLRGLIEVAAALLKTKPEKYEKLKTEKITQLKLSQDLNHIDARAFMVFIQQFREQKDQLIYESIEFVPFLKELKRSNHPEVKKASQLLLTQTQAFLEIKKLISLEEEVEKGLLDFELFFEQLSEPLRGDLKKLFVLFLGHKQNSSMTTLEKCQFYRDLADRIEYWENQAAYLSLPRFDQASRISVRIAFLEPEKNYNELLAPLKSVGKYNHPTDLIDAIAIGKLHGRFAL